MAIIIALVDRGRLEGICSLDTGYPTYHVQYSTVLCTASVQYLATTHFVQGQAQVYGVGSGRARYQQHEPDVAATGNHLHRTSRTVHTEHVYSSIAEEL